MAARLAQVVHADRDLEVSDAAALAIVGCIGTGSGAQALVAGGDADRVGAVPVAAALAARGQCAAEPAGPGGFGGAATGTVSVTASNNAIQAQEKDRRYLENHDEEEERRESHGGEARKMMAIERSS